MMSTANNIFLVDFRTATIKLQLMFIDQYRKGMESSTDATLKSIFGFMENNLDDEKYV